MPITEYGWPAGHPANAADADADTAAVQAPAHPQQPAEAVVLMPRAQLRESPHNPRRSYDERALDELADSIASQGMLQPIVVRPIAQAEIDPTHTHEIVFGHRRFRAAAQAGLDDVPVIVRDMSDAAARLAQHAENLHRQDVHYLEEADSLAELIASGMSADKLAADLGKSRSYVYGRAKLAQLGEPGRISAMHHGLPAEIALMIARLPTSVQPTALSAIDEVGGWVSAREAKRRLARLATPLHRATWPLHDAHLLDYTGQPAPSCNHCQDNSLNDNSLTDISEPSCMARPCWDRKQLAQRERDAAMTRESGILVAEPGSSHSDPDKTDTAATPTSTAAPAPGVESNRHSRPAAPKTQGVGFDGWTPDEIALSSEGGWERARRAIFGRLLAAPRTIDDLRLIVLDSVMTIGDFGVSEGALGLPGDTPWSDLPDIIATLTADQLSAISVMLAIESIGGRSCLSADGGQDRAAQRVRLANAYGVDPLAPGGGGGKPGQNDNAGQPAGGATEPGSSASDLLGDPIEADECQTTKPAAPAIIPRKRGPEVRYRCPQTGSVWSGRGLKPRWLVAALSDGRALAEFEVSA